VSSLSKYLKRHFTLLVAAIRRLRGQRWRFGSLQGKFTRIYRRNVWGNAESVSGVGSTLRETEVIRRGLPAILERISARTLLDLPCGDFNWMKGVNLNVDIYIGGDIVRELVELNAQRYGNDQRRFVTLDITRDRLPEVDVILCRDCLGHFEFADIFLALCNFKHSKSKYLLTTTYPSVRENEDIFSSDWRPINLQSDPFCFPEPLWLVNEQSLEGSESDKSLGLWRVSTLPG